MLALARPAPAEEALTAAGVRFPTYNEKMEMTSQIFGDTAKVMPNGFVELTNLRMEFYSGGESNRKVQMEVSSPHCLYHRDRGAAASEKDVRIVNENMIVTGTGFVWQNEAQVLKIARNSKVVLKNARRGMEQGVKP
jgi:hypothetical protein